ncbi:unnamed protein product [Camellia sinensis]
MSMGRIREEEPDLKSQLVTEICNLSKRAITCAHGSGRSNPTGSPFIDWFLVLRVEENEGLDVIRKQYRKLALQLHPDKNKHPKAEIAFKLVSEAYACLSDNARRAEFNLERQNSNCNECNRTGYATCNGPATRDAKIKGSFPIQNSRSRKIKQRINHLRARFSEEASVIENCLRAIRTSTKGELPVFDPSTKEHKIFNPSTKDHPVFNPTDYLFQGYPHHQRTGVHKKPEKFHYSWAENVPNYEPRRCESPIYDFRSQNGAIKFKYSCLR